MGRQLIFAGGYTEDAQMASGEVVPGRCSGIGCWELRNGRLMPLSAPAPAVNPSYILVHPTAPYLYCVNEVKTVDGIPGATVSAYEICDDRGTLRLLNRQATAGADPCHLAFSPDGSYLIAANYSGGSVCVFPILEDHSLDHASCLLRHHGAGTNPQRQEGPHPHQILLHPAENLVYVSDLGLDRLCCYEGRWDCGWLQPREEWDIEVPCGQGARHGVFSADGSRLYLMTEMGCTVHVYSWDQGKTTLIQSVALAQENGANLGAAIRLHPNGKFLFVSVRGADLIGVFRVEKDGRLTLLDKVPVGGKIPRDFIVTPDGQTLLVGCQDSHRVCVFSVNPLTGQLTPGDSYPDFGSVTTLCHWISHPCAAR